ncbi:MAG: LEA type 2 family protein [Gemmatimonadaceae bacterium]
MRRFVVLATAAVAVAGATGCASLGRKAFKEPTVSFKELRVNGLGLTGGSLDILLNIYNPNGYKLDATRFTYNLMVDSVNFGSGAIDQKFTVQSGDSTTVRLPLTFTYAGIGSAGRSLLNTGTVNYTVTGDITVGTPLGNFTKPYTQRGTYTAMGGAR